MSASIGAPPGLEPPAPEKQANAEGVSGFFGRAAKEPANSAPNASVTALAHHLPADGASLPAHTDRFES